MLTSVPQRAVQLIKVIGRHRVAMLNTIIISMVAVGATAVAMKSSREKLTSLTSANTPTVSRDGKTPNIPQTASQDAGVNSQGKTVTPAEAQKLVAGVKQLANPSSQGLTEVHHGDGSVSMDLQGHFQNVMIAARNEDGTVSQACVNNPENAAQFLNRSTQKVAPQAPSVREELK